MALQAHLAILRPCGFVPMIVYTYPASMFRAITQEFSGLENDIGRAGDHLAMISSCIHCIKEHHHIIKNGLPWELPKSKVKELLA